MAVDTFKMTERTKALVDALDEGLSPNEAARKLRVSPSVVAGERKRYPIRAGKSIVLGLAEKFAKASPEEIAEACGRDKAPEILARVGISRKAGRYNQARVKAMRASLMEGA